MPSLEQLEKLLAAEPDDPFVLYAIAQEYAKTGRHAEAIAFYDRCLAVNADYCYAYYHKARECERIGDLPAARASLESGLKAAKRTGDAKALSEITGYLDTM